MKSWLSLILLVALWAVVLHLLLTPEIVGQPAPADDSSPSADTADPQQGAETATLSVAVGHGVPHVDARFLEMNQGGSGQQRHAAVLLAGWLFGALQIALFTGLLAWSAGLPAAGQVQPTGSRQSHPWFLWGMFSFGGLLFEGVFALLCRAYQVSLLDPAATRFLGSFPEATTWLLFGIWFAPGFFVALYVFYFDRWGFSPQAQTRFEALLAARTVTSPTPAEDV